MLRGPAARTLVWVSLIALFAGCTDNPLPEANEVEAGALPGVPTSVGIEALPVGYAGPEHVMKERWENGSFTAVDSAWPVGGYTHPVLGTRQAERTFDITDDLPVGVPVMVMLEVTASTRPGETWPYGGDIDIGLRADFMDFIWAEWDVPYGGTSSGTVWVQRVSGNPIFARVYYGELDASTEVRYTMHISIMGSANMVPPGGVVGLKLAPGELLVLEPMMGSAEVSLFDGADNYVDRYDVRGKTEIRVPAAASPGEFVLVNKQEGTALRVAAVRNETTPLRAIGFEWVAGVEKPIGEGTTKWEETVTRPIVATGLSVYNTADQPYRCPATSAKMIGPGGDELLSAAYEEPRCAGRGPQYAFELWERTPIGMSAVREGTYSMEVTASEPLNLNGQQWFLHYLR